MAAENKYPIGVQSFQEIRQENYTYVDKTMYIHQLVESGKSYFLSRPRRFGKSLLISTVECLFRGKKDLFAGLAIYEMNWDWDEYPVLNFDLSGKEYTSPVQLDDILHEHLRRWEAEYGYSLEDKSPDERFRTLIRTIFEKTGKRVVILVDEYDQPLLHSITDTELNATFKKKLQAFYAVLKTMDPFIRFAMLTGISRFSKVSVFSGANHLKDISLDKRYSSICGITEEELHEYFLPGIKEFAEENDLTETETFNLLKENYDGYHFSKKSPDVYNPFSVLNALDSKETSDYWFESGTPSHILDIMRRDNFYLPSLDCIDLVESDLGAKESYLNNPISLLYESGYLTIKSYDDEKKLYRLAMPNEEVSISFSRALIPVYSGYGNTECMESLNKMRSAIIDGDADRFMDLLKTFLHGNPYSNTEIAKRETYFKNNIFLVFKALGFLPRSEEETCNSRMDIMLRTRRFIYIFELKTNHTSEEALQQIFDKGCALPYAEEGKKIILIAANYSTAINNIDSFIIKQL